MGVGTAATIATKLVGLAAAKLQRDVVLFLDVMDPVEAQG